jgi:hypothetical protein
MALCSAGGAASLGSAAITANRMHAPALVACYRALRKAIAKNKPMKRKDRARVAERLRGLGWTEFAIGAATKPGPDLESSGGSSQNRGIVKS